MRKLLNILVMFMPWRIKRLLLVKFYGYELHPKAHIGLSYVFPKHLVMEEGAHIGSLSVAIHLDYMRMGRNASVGRSNWITGFPTGTNSPHFAWQKDRKSELVVGAESAITKNHHIDCTNSVKIGDYVTIAGYASQFLTHSIDVYEGRQGSKPIEIGDYCFVSTRVTVLGGATLPSHSVLAAGAVLQKSFDEEWTLYGGVPAKPIKSLPHDAKYLIREKGYVY